MTCSLSPAIQGERARENARRNTRFLSSCALASIYGSDPLEPLPASAPVSPPPLSHFPVSMARRGREEEEEGSQVGVADSTDFLVNRRFSLSNIAHERVYIPLRIFGEQTRSFRALDLPCESSLASVCPTRYFIIRS